MLANEELIREYSEECSIPEIGPINPQRHIYDRMEESGLMHGVGAFDGEKLVGFALLLIFVLPHYGKKVANVESMFLAKSHRKCGEGRNLIRHIESVAKDHQCSAMLYNVRQGTRLESLMTALPEYKQTNSVFLKNL